MADWIINVVAFLGTLLGIFMVTGAPFIQKKIVKGKRLEELEEKRNRTEDEEWELQQLQKPFKFNQYYFWTAAGGFIFAIVAVMTQINSLFGQLTNVSDWTAAFLTGITFGVTGNWVANQFVKSETTRSVLQSQTGSTRGPTTSQVTDKVKAAVEVVAGSDKPKEKVEEHDD